MVQPKYYNPRGQSLKWKASMYINKLRLKIVFISFVSSTISVIDYSNNRILEPKTMWWRNRKTLNELHGQFVTDNRRRRGIVENGSNRVDIDLSHDRKIITVLFIILMRKTKNDGNKTWTFYLFIIASEKQKM